MTDVSVTFGGLRAVDRVAIVAHPGEVVGLIGTNGAGKSTLMNAIGGFAPAEGVVEMLGTDVSGHSASARARVGLGRTFQAARLFPELTVRETVQVALEARGRTGLLSTALFLPSSSRAERAMASDASDLIDFLGLGRYADGFVAELSTGTRRIVELAGLLALDAQILCLDEPTAGVAQRETEAFGPLLKQIQQELHATMIVIEHDMPMIMALSDRVYCLEAGQVIAEGSPDRGSEQPPGGGQLPGYRHPGHRPQRLLTRRPTVRYGYSSPSLPDRFPSRSWRIVVTGFTAGACSSTCFTQTVRCGNGISMPLASNAFFNRARMRRPVAHCSPGSVFTASRMEMASAPKFCTPQISGSSMMVVDSKLLAPDLVGDLFDDAGRQVDVGVVGNVDIQDRAGPALRRVADPPYLAVWDHPQRHR